MRRATIAYMDNGLPVQCFSERDFLFPDADEKYVPDVLAYIQSYDFKTFNALLTKTPEEVVATFPYFSDREKSFACRALFDQWAKCLAEGRRRIPPHLMEWMARRGSTVMAGMTFPALSMSSPGAPSRNSEGEETRVGAHRQRRKDALSYITKAAIYYKVNIAGIYI